MPGDTLVINHQNDSLPVTDTLSYHAVLPTAAGTPEHHRAGTGFVLLILLSIITIPLLYHWLEQKIRKMMALKAALRDMQANFTKYDTLLSAYNGYYNSLPDHLRKKFVERVIWFTNTKTFSCVNLAPDDRMPWLISAASIQISFGLDNYLLDFFDTVYIMQRNYNYGFSQKPFEGHVSSEGIYLSWDNFIRGYNNYTDGDNVGIHEMAHALAYVNFMAGENSGQDNGFIQRFYEFSAIARPIFTDMQNGNTNLLNNYAATNYNEFWAVAVETFFEKSLQMKIEMPGLYDAMCNLLNQDPLLPEKLLRLTAAIA